MLSFQMLMFSYISYSIHLFFVSVIKHRMSIKPLFKNVYDV